MDVLMPQLGETVVEGTISKWYKAIGDAVAAGEPLFDIETEKTAMEVPAIVAGVLHEIRVPVGQTVAVGAVVGVIAEKDGARQVSVAATGEEPGVVDSRAAHVAAAQRIDPLHGLRTPGRNYGKATLPSGVRITPLARRLAADAGLDVEGLQGSGPRGRIVAADVRRRAGGVETVASVSSPGGDPVRALYATTVYRELPLDGMRRQMARRLSEAKQQVPHFYVSADLKVDSLLALRQQFNEAGSQRISLNDVLVRAYALALQQVPAANVVWAGDGLLQLARSDVGVAVAVPGGLLTPVLRGADTLKLPELAAELAKLIARGRERRLQPHEYSGGSATVSNLGMYGVRGFQAIVNPPQATILAVGTAERRPIEAPDGTLRVATLLSVTLSVDHRAVDGAVAGELLAALRAIVESPLRIFL